MRFQFSRVKEIYIPKEIEDELLIKKYVQSFLCWIYRQNEDFSEYLTREEISNYFFTHLIHPVWFSIYMKENTFKKSVEIDRYIHSSKTKPADKVFEYHYQIHPKDDAPYIPLRQVDELINQEQRKILIEGGYGMTDISRLSKEEADYVILKMRDEKKSV